MNIIKVKSYSRSLGSYLLNEFEVGIEYDNNYKYTKHSEKLCSNYRCVMII